MSKRFQSEKRTLGVLAILVTGMGIYSCAEPQARTASRSDLLPPEVDMVMTRVRFFEFQNNRLSWEFSGQTLAFREDEQEMAVTRPAARIYLENGELVSVRSRQALYSGREGRIEMSGEVSGENNQGYHLETERLIYLDGSHELQTEGRAKVWGQGIKLEGENLRADLLARRVEMSGQVRLRAERLQWGGG